MWKTPTRVPCKSNHNKCGHVTSSNNMCKPLHGADKAALPTAVPYGVMFTVLVYKSSRTCQQFQRLAPVAGMSAFRTHRTFDVKSVAVAGWANVYVLGKSYRIQEVTKHARHCKPHSHLWTVETTHHANTPYEYDINDTSIDPKRCK